MYFTWITAILAFSQQLWENGSQTSIRASERVAYHYHHAFMEPPFGNKYPEDVIQESTAKKHCSNLFNKRRDH